MNLLIKGVRLRVKISRMLVQFGICSDQRYILRERRPSTAACPACWAMGTKELKFCTRPTIAPMEEQNLLYRHEKPNEQSEEGPHRLNTLSPHLHTSVTAVSIGATPL